MISLVPALILAFISFIASAFIILRIVVPILPPHPLSKRVSPAEFGLPTFRSLSPADKGHLWLASLDIVALALFIWQVVNESTSGPTGVALATDTGSAIRLWILVTIRQTCLLFVAAITLLHIRMARSVSFGARHWMIWAPTALLVFTSTAVAGILSGTGVNTLFAGMTAYTISIAAFSILSFGYLVHTLFAIKRNLAAIDEASNPWPPLRTEDLSRPSLATEDVDAVRDGASWITSIRGSRRNSVSAWSFSTTTHHTCTSSHYHGRPQTAIPPSVPAKSSYWFGAASTTDIQIPPVPPLPSPLGPLSPTMADADPFRKDPLFAKDFLKQQKQRFGSQTSWLTESQSLAPTVTAWSFPTTNSQYEPSVHGGTIYNSSTHDLDDPKTRPSSPAMADAQVLGGYGYAPGGMEEKGFGSVMSSVEASVIEISLLPAFAWSVMILLPLSLALPYFITLSQQMAPPWVMEILFVLSVTLSSPVLAINLLCGAPFPIPVGLFDSVGSLPAVSNGPMIHGSFPPPQFAQEYKRSTSMSVTVVEPRRSGDVWLSKGDAVDGKSKIGRAVGMLQARPKLSVLPPEDSEEVLEEPPVPFGLDSTGEFHVNGTPRSEVSAQFGRLGKDSRMGSNRTGVTDITPFSSEIMVAQRHYSAMAQTVVVPGPNSPLSSNNRDSAGAATLVGATTGVMSKRNSQVSHLRSRSTSSVVPSPTFAAQQRASPTPPPRDPLPPTPPSVRSARLAKLAHKKSFSSGLYLGKDFDDEMNEIDALTAGVLPLLVPGLKVGEDMRIKKGGYTAPGTSGREKGRKAPKKLAEFGEDQSTRQAHTTAAARRQPRSRKESGHKKKNFSLPSLGVGRASMNAFSTWDNQAVDNAGGQYACLPTEAEGHERRNDVDDIAPVQREVAHLRPVQEESFAAKSIRPLGRTPSTRSMGLRADVPHDVDTARSSMVSLANMPPSAASTVTLFEEMEGNLLDKPLAESTPHSSSHRMPPRRPAPPMPMPNGRRTSGIYYKKSIESEQPVTPPMNVDEEENEVEVSPLASIANFSSRALRLIPKASKLHRGSAEVNSPKEGLRTLTLLQDRGNNMNNSPPETSEIRPLAIGRAQKVRRIRQDENASIVRVPSRNKNLKSLTLVRSETSKMRGILRQNEVLPDVVVRPPSTTEHNIYAYNFRD